MTVTFATESYEQVIEEIKPLNAQHWDEIALNKDFIGLDPDYEFYEAMDRLGRMVVATARDDDGPLIGYAIYFLGPHKHYREHLWAISDIYWIHPEHRRGRVGMNLFKFVEQALRTRKVSVMHTTSKTAHPAAARMLESLGHTMIEVGHSKRLG